MFYPCKIYNIFQLTTRHVVEFFSLIHVRFKTLRRRSKKFKYFLNFFLKFLNNFLEFWSVVDLACILVDLGDEIAFFLGVILEFVKHEFLTDFPPKKRWRREIFVMLYFAYKTVVILIRNWMFSNTPQFDTFRGLTEKIFWKMTIEFKDFWPIVRFST